jgi:hypothetical protein
VLGVGMTKSIKPRGMVDYTELGSEARVKAMLDAQINYDDVDQGSLSPPCNWDSFRDPPISPSICSLIIASSCVLLLRRFNLRPTSILPI